MSIMDHANANPDREHLMLLLDTLADEMGKQRSDLDLQATVLQKQTDELKSFDARLAELRSLVEAGVMPVQAALSYLSPLEREMLPKRFSSAAFMAAISEQPRKQIA